MLDMDINQEALGVLPQSKAVEELTNSVGYAVSGKLNDIQANQLLKNMQKMESFIIHLQRQQTLQILQQELEIKTNSRWT